jgi:hypothetical protein
MYVHTKSSNVKSKKTRFCETNAGCSFFIASCPPRCANYPRISGCVRRNSINCSDHAYLSFCMHIINSDKMVAENLRHYIRYVTLSKSEMPNDKMSKFLIFFVKMWISLISPTLTLQDCSCV